MGLLLQLRLLLWKNFTLRKRQPVRIVVEIAWPLILFIILVWVKLDNNDLQVWRHECHFDGKAMPSAGFLPFFQTLLCAANNTCHKSPRSDKPPGSIHWINSSALSQLLDELQNTLYELTESQLIEKLAVDLEYITQVTNILQLCDIKLKGWIKNTTAFQKQLKEQNVTLSKQFVDTLVNSEVNATELLLLLSERSFQIQTDSEDFQQEFCQHRYVERILITDSKEVKQRLNNELCSLTSAEFARLTRAVSQNIDTRNLVGQAQSCIEDEVISGRFDLPLKWLGMRSHLQEAYSMSAKFSDLISLSDKVFNLSKLPDWQQGMNNSNWLLSFVSDVLCESDTLLNRTFQEDEDYLYKIVDMKKKDSGESHFGNETDASYTYDSSTSLFCNDIFYRMEQFENPGVRMLWRQIKPLIRGKILYSPNTPLVHRIIRKANWTFEYMARVQSLASHWLGILPSIHQFVNSSPITRQQLRAGVYTASLMHPQDKNLESLLNWMDNRPEYFNGINWNTVLQSSEMFMSFLATYLQCFRFDKFEPYHNESELVRASLEYIDDQLLWAGLVFNDTGGRFLSDKGMPTHISFKIRMDSDRVDSTVKFKVTDRYWSPDPRIRPLPDMKYIVFGFAYIQDLVEHAIISEQTGIDDIGISVQQFPYPCYIDDRFTFAISRTLPLFMTLAWIYSVAMIVKGIVYEKEQRLKEVMKIMGLGNSVHWMSWFITSVIMLGFSIMLLVIVLKVGKVLEHSDGFVVFVFMMTFGVATIMQCFMFSVFFSKANLAAACAAIFYFIGYLPYALCVQWEEFMEYWQKSIACLSSTVAFGFGCSYIARYEQQGVGIQWYNIKGSSIPEDSFSMFSCIIMMIIDAAIYAVITWYVEAVFPGQFGVPKPWYFFLTHSYWCGKQFLDDNALTVDANIELRARQNDTGYFEAEPKHLKLGVHIEGLHKIYKNSKRLAVDDLTLNFYEGQITSFLGHNGAGKTTTMSILTGLFPPTQGTANIYGKDIRFEMDEIHKDMGVCPQHNVLFDDLTVQEHLFFYGSLKGMKGETRKQEIKKMIIDVGLPHKQNALAKNLSGGTKRKLSIAVAFTAGSHVVILDEPTAGVDPYARRSIWDLLLKYKAGRTIILSTHFMDEADILGDRIAIISHGKLWCCGSSLFLKNLFGSGYYLTFTLSEDKSDKDDENGKCDFQSTDFLSDPSDVALAPSINSLASQFLDEQEDVAENQKKIMRVIHSHISGAKFVENLASEFTVQLPDDKESVAKFNNLFMEIDRDTEKLGITGYGISNTTLEEVFLKVAHISGVDEELGETERPEIKFELNTNTESLSHPANRFCLRNIRKLFGRSRRKYEVNGVLNEGVIGEQNEENLSLLNTPVFSEVALEDFTITESSEGRSNEPAVDASPVENECSGAGSYRVSGRALIFRQFCALFVRRFHYVRRSKKAFMSQIVLPAIFICLAMIFSKINPPIPEMPPMEIHPWLLIPLKLNDSRLYAFFSNKVADERWSQAVEELLLVKPGLGTRCMDPLVHTLLAFPCSENAHAIQLNTGIDYGNSTRHCSCSTGYQQCPAEISQPEPEKFLLPTTDYLYNLTNKNISEWILKTTADYRLKRYGGLQFDETNEIMKFNRTSLEFVISQLISTAYRYGNVSNFQNNPNVTALLDDIKYISSRLVVSKNAKVWFNNKGYVSMVAYMNAVNNILLRANLEPGYDIQKYGISVISHPMNRTKAQMAQYAIRASGVDALIAISVIFALSQIPASFVLFLIEERQTGCKHLQFVSGVNPTIYWVVNYAWDMCNYMVSGTICICLFLAFQQKEYVSQANAPCLVALLFLYGWAITPMMYPVSYIFSVPSTAFVVMGCINIFIGILSTISTFILELFMEERLDRINDILRNVFLILPHFCLGRGLIDMTRNQIVADIFTAFGENLFRNPFNWDLVGKNLFCLFVLGIVFFIVTLCIEYQFWSYKMQCWKRLSLEQEYSAEEIPDEDADVAAERRRMGEGQEETDVLKIISLTKMYKTLFSKKTHLAVNNITVGVKKGECFGLLGVNGAGKTTTFKMLTGDLSVTSGNAFIDGHSILTDMILAHQCLGYCPQFDALISLLTTEEHLEMFARLRGVPERDVSTVTKWAVQRLGLTTHQRKCAEDLSGGNKRKLSTAIALVGNPSVIFLDEPTTGMDPKARRFLWNCINAIKRDGRSVILTSHSMEECEALCDRIAIMVNGSFQCLGSIQHLKNRFGFGYTVMIRVTGENPDLSPLKLFISEKFPASQLKEQHFNMLHYQFASKTVPLSHIFGTIESVRSEYNIEDYSVCQTTLDQVFINFAQYQTEVQNEEIDVANTNGVRDCPVA